MSHWSALIDLPAAPGATHHVARVRHAFGPPRRWLVARKPDEVRDVLNAAHDAAVAGQWCVGQIQFEAAAAFDRALVTHAPGPAPLACFAVMGDPRPWPLMPSGGWHAEPWHDPTGEATFTASMDQLRDWIGAGDIYQANLTTRLESTLTGDPLAYFGALHRAQSRGYGIYLVHGDTRWLSVSPELFFDWREGAITTQPMKGTAPRGATPAADEAAAAGLRASAKERAENLMIVDLLRNDVSRIAQLGSVCVPRLFELHALPTVWQMTSTIVAHTRPHLRLADVFAALFPCGSVTGAPKVRAMQILRELEATARGLYCGAMGVLQPGGAVTFNVPIRTVTLTATAAAQGVAIDAPRFTAQCGIGSGITADATTAAEAAEWRIKQRFLTLAGEPFELLESLRLENGVVWLRDEHRQRLATSAAHFAFNFRPEAVDAALQAACSAHPAGVFKLRVLLAADGNVRWEAAALTPTVTPLTLALASAPMPPADDFIRHKTTRRGAYAPFMAPQGAFDTVLWNVAGDVSECVNGNLAVLRSGQWLTPPLSAGLLPGTCRAHLLRAGKITEAPLAVDDLRTADDIAYFNSVRGWLPALLMAEQ